MPNLTEDQLREQNEALADEIIAINAIHTPTTLVLDTTISDEADVSTIPAFSCVLTIPPPVDSSLRLSFSRDYPDEKPEVVAVASLGSGMKVGSGNALVDLAREVIDSEWQSGQECVDRVLEEILAQYGDNDDDDDDDDEKDSISRMESLAIVKSNGSSQPTNSTSLSDAEMTDRWVLSNPELCLKSVFIARVATVRSVDDAKGLIQHLVDTNKRVSEATHNITAWRIRGPDGSTVSYQDCFDDGETAAGGRVLHLLQLADVWNVVVVVSRWYGGVKLGPDRFRIISNVARDALVAGGHIVLGAKKK